MPHTEVKIVDENGRIVPRSECGELCTRGYSVMIGYWGDEARTREVLDTAGWMHSGDLATIDEEGYCRIIGRIKDLVIRGGENISPREVEEYLYRHPGVRDVQVTGVPDAKFGEELCAWIICVPIFRRAMRISARSAGGKSLTSKFRAISSSSIPFRRLQRARFKNIFYVSGSPGS